MSKYEQKGFSFPPMPTPLTLEEELAEGRRMAEYEAQRRLQRNLEKRRKHAKVRPTEE